MLNLPKGEKAEIQTVDGIQYLVVRLVDSPKTCEEYIKEIQNNRPVVVPASKRGHMVGELKKKGIFATSKAIEVGWILFTPSAPREFRP